MSKSYQQRPIRTITAKLRNRRVRGSLLADGTFVWSFKNLIDGVVQKKRIRVSREAFEAMVFIFMALKQPADAGKGEKG